MRAELDQLAGLITDATSRLTASFETICTLSARQQQLASAVASGGCSCGAEAGSLPVHSRGAPDPEQRDLRALTDNIQRSVNEAVTALQFHDIASQLIGHAARRIELIERMAGQLERLPGDPGGALACTAQRDNPVGQVRMTAGTIELF